MPRWSYDIGELIALGVEVDPLQEQILEEGGKLLTFWPLLQWATRVYPRGAKMDRWYDQAGESIMVPVMFEATPWTDNAHAALSEIYGEPYADAALTWPSYLGQYEEEGFLTPHLDLNTEVDVLRLYNGIPLGPEPAFNELQLAADRMFTDTGINDQMAYYMAVEGDEWFPDLIGGEPQTRLYDDDPDQESNQNMYLDLVNRGLVHAEGWIVEPLQTKPIEHYVRGDASLVEPWYDLLGSSWIAHHKVSRVLAQDNHRFYDFEEVFSPWV